MPGGPDRSSIRVAKPQEAHADGPKTSCAQGTLVDKLSEPPVGITASSKQWHSNG